MIKYYFWHIIFFLIFSVGFVAIYLPIALLIFWIFSICSNDDVTGDVVLVTLSIGLILLLLVDIYLARSAALKKVNQSLNTYHCIRFTLMELSLSLSTNPIIRLISKIFRRSKS